MSFIDEEDILRLIEEMFIAMVEQVVPEKKVIKPFPRLSYREAMEKYGSDKPDLRFGMEIADFTDIAAQSEFNLFKKVIADGGKIKGFCARGCADYSRTQLEELNRFIQNYGAGGLLTFALSPAAGSMDQLTIDMVKSVAAKYLTLEQIKEMARRTGGGPGDLLLIVAGKTKIVEKALGEVRKEMGYKLKLADPNQLAFAFVVNFPLFAWNEETKAWEPEHHPFTAPMPEDVLLIDSEPGKVRARHYDIICNGYELASGSIRINNPQLQRKIFRMLGYKDEEITQRFGTLLEAFEYGAPPHGGIAPGIDRIVMILSGEENIREVIAFPKNQNAADVMLEAPSPVDRKQLEELHIEVRLEESAK
jgi:aspartyl-tRNA synthetase